MIKGVNKKVIEINKPDSAYFERAVLYLKPDVNEVPLHATQIETLDYFSQNQKKKSQNRNFLFFLLGAATSGVLGWMAFQFLH